MKKTHTALLMGVSMILASGLAWAGGTEGPVCHHRGPGKHRAPALNLTEAQKAQIQPIREKYRTRLDELRKQDLDKETKRARFSELHKKMQAEISPILTQAQRDQIAKMGDSRGKFAGRRGDRRQGDRRAMAQRLSKELDLTPEQEQKLKGIRDAHRAELRALMQDARSGKVEKAQVRERAQALREKVTGEMNTVLTPEQQQKLKTLHEQRASRFRK